MNETIFQNFPTTLYLAKVKLFNNHIEIVDFKLLNHGQNTLYSKEEFNKDFILKNLNYFDFKEAAHNLHKNPNKKFNIKYQFKDKNGKIHIFKDTLKVIEKNKNIYTLLGLGINISKEEELSQIFDSIVDSNHMGILIYKNKIVFYDDYAKNLFESDTELYNLSPIDLFPDFMKKNIKHIIQRRLKGEKFNKYYSLEIPSFKNNRKYIEFYGYTILYEGEFAGLTLGVDKTKFFKHKKMMELLRNVNTILLKQIFNKELLLEEIISQIKKISYFKNVFINEKPIKKENFYNLQIKDEYLVFEAKYNDDFDKLCIETLEEIQKNIQKALKDINKNLTLIILNKALEQSFQWLIITENNGKIIYVNDAVTKISGYKKEELLGKNIKLFDKDISLSPNNNISLNVFKFKDKKDNIFYLKNKILPVKLPNNKNYFVSMGIDITAQKQLEKQLTNIKLSDEITDLPNRNGILIAGNTALNNNKKTALLIIDIKDFKAINTIKGNKFGNDVLKQFSNFLKIFFTNKSIIGRLGNDEFVVLTEFDNISKLKKQINVFIKKLKEIEINSLKISINIGISTYPKDTKNIEELIEKAFIALKHAKNNGDFNYLFYNKNLKQELENLINTKSILTNSIKNDNFIYYFQPYVSTEDFSIKSAESLIRIVDKDQIINPSTFIDYAENSGLIKDIEIILAKKAAKLLDKISIPLSFNISAVSLKDKKHLSKLLNITKNYANQMIIEITERELLFNTKEIIRIFDKLKNMGYKIAIDDFGTGYSSFSYIKNIPLDYLKIDMSFIKNIETSKKDLAIVDAMINFSKKLDIKTVAEGIENKNQVEILKNLGCDYLQGYYFYKPITFEKLQNLLNNSESV